VGKLKLLSIFKKAGMCKAFILQILTDLTELCLSKLPEYHWKSLESLSTLLYLTSTTVISIAVDGGKTSTSVHTKKRWYV